MKLSKKIAKIMELATTINAEPTERGQTGDKPTVFVDFAGHVARLRVDIHSCGWDSEEPYVSSDKSWNVKICDEKAEKNLDEIIIELLSIMPECKYSQLSDYKKLVTKNNNKGDKN